MKHQTIVNPIRGTVLSKNPVVDLSNPVVSICGTAGEKDTYITFNDNVLSTGILSFGATGSGKTVLQKKITKQLRAKEDNYSMVVLEVKDDYRDYLSEPGDLILGSTKESVKWNLFEDILYNTDWDYGKIKLNCMEISKQLIGEHKNETQPFFTDASILLLNAVLLTCIQDAEKSLVARMNLNNKGLRDFFAQYEVNQYENLIDRCEEPGTLRMILGENTDNLQALGVIAETVTVILTNLVDTFGAEGDFSIRRFVKEKEKRALFLQYDPAYKQIHQKLFGLFTTLMLKEVLAQDKADGKVIFVCDELPVIGKVDLPTAINLGRAKGLICIAGLQSCSQIYNIYGKDEGNVLFAGFCTKIVFRLNDEVSRSYVRDCFGKNLVEYMSISSGGNVVHRTEGYVVEDSDLVKLQVGDCIVGVLGYSPYAFHIYE